MLTKRPPAQFYAPILIMVCLVTFYGQAHSTTVAVLESKQGFVILADSKQTHTGPENTFCRGGDIKKVFIAQGRFAIAAVGNGCLYGTYRENGVISEVSYNIDSAWVQELQSNLPKDVSMEQFVKSTEAKFSSLVPKLQGALTAGYLQPTDLRNGRFETFIKFVIVGYDKGLPTVCILSFDIDWNTRHFAESFWGGDFGPVDGLDMGFYAFGTAQAVTDILNPKSYGHIQAMAACPKAFTNFISRRPVSLEDSVSIGRVLVQIEEKVNPEKVGGKITGVQILPNGKATELSDPNPAPKGVAGKHQQKH
jgi:hypothetical protein